MVVVGGATELAVAAAVVVVEVASRSFFRRRNRDVSSTSTIADDGAAVDFFGLAADGAPAVAVVGDICCAFASFASADEVASADRLPVDSQPLAVRELFDSHLGSELLASSEQRIVSG